MRKRRVEANNKIVLFISQVGERTNPSACKATINNRALTPDDGQCESEKSMQFRCEKWTDFCCKKGAQPGCWPCCSPSEFSCRVSTGQLFRCPRRSYMTLVKSCNVLTGYSSGTVTRKTNQVGREEAKLIASVCATNSFASGRKHDRHKV